jgi:hypothetical protein
VRKELALLTLLTIFAINSFAAAPPRVNQGFPPTCTPIPALPVSYVGAVSGCSSQPGMSATCLAGETIQFKYGDGLNACCPASYVWEFEDGPIPSGLAATINHTFPTAGTFNVKVSAYACPDPVVVTKTVPVAAASAIPVLNNAAAGILLLALALIAASRLR